MFTYISTVIWWLYFFTINKNVIKKIGSMTQYQLYKKSGVPQSTLSTILNCSYPSVKIRIIYEICEGFEISLEDFFDSPLFERENIDD